MTFSRTTLPGWYFGIQAASIVVWWLYLWRFPETRMLFLPPGASEEELLTFALPDLAIAASASAGTAVAFFLRYRFVFPLAWMSTGAMAYAFAYCVAWSLIKEGGWLNVVAMAPAALLSAVCAVDVSAENNTIFRRASPSSAARHVLMTLGQIVVFWTFFLYVVPLALRSIERNLPWPALQFAPHEAVATVLFVAFSGLGLWSGICIARNGSGTPLPFDATNRLVVCGPYAYVRNPMAIAGLGQGAVVGLGFGSGMVVAYVLLGTAIWQFLVRPSEEHDLHNTFGEAFDRYRGSVRCWIPRLTAYTDLPKR